MEQRYGRRKESDRGGFEGGGFEGGNEVLSSVQQDGAPLGPTVVLSVRVTPADARVYLDDTLLSVGSFRGQIPCRLASRSLCVVAHGYVPWGERIILVTDTTIAVALARQSSVHVPPPPRPVRVVLHAPDEPAPDSSPPSSTDPLAVTMVC